MLFLKKLNSVKLIFALSSCANLIIFFLYSPELVDASGPFPPDLVWNLKSNDFLHLMPFQLTSLLPYWGFNGWPVVLLHISLNICLCFDYRPKVTTLILLLFEYCFIIRLGYLTHVGNLFTLIAYSIWVVDSFLPSKKRYVAYYLWLIQFSFVYLIAGLNKHTHEWLISGMALQNFYNLERLNLGLNAIDLGLWGQLISRTIKPIEIASPILIFLCFFFNSINKRIAYAALVALSLVHVGAIFFFKLLTLPLIGLGVLFGIFLTFRINIKTSYVQKFIPFVFVICIQFLPSLGLDSLSRAPFGINWTMFRLPVKVKSGEMRLELIKDNKITYENTFKDSFHWSRYRFMVDKSKPNYLELRNSMNRYLCEKYNGEVVKWYCPHGLEKYDCSSHHLSN